MTIRSAHTKQHFLPGSLRALIIASGFWALSLSLTVTSGSAAALLGCLFACLLVDASLYRSPLNQLSSGALLSGFLLVAVVGELLAHLVVSSSAMAGMISPVNAFNSSEFLSWLSLSFALTASLRVLAHRTGYGAVLEIIFVAAAFTVTLAAHRNGMIHRPFFLGDFALIRGIDPASILMVSGCGAVLALAALLMMEANPKRLPYHFGVLALLCLSLIGYIQLFGVPSPNITNEMGLTGQQEGTDRSQQENPFSDGENTGNEKEAPVAVVVFRDDYEPLNGSYYFRESAYSEFNGAMLDFTNRDDMDRDLIEEFTAAEVETEVLPGARDQRVEVRTSVGMLVPHRSPFGLASPVSYKSVANPNKLRFKRTYDVNSLAPEYDFEYLLGRELGREQWSAEVWQEYLTLPDDPRYRQLAESLIDNLRPEYAEDPFAKAWAIKNYLDENGIYSLKNQHAYEADPAASFLFGDLTGYCMHFSFAATYLYRSLGIPARVGIGYSVPASNRAGGSALLVQAVHGHAWPEIYLKDIGWVIVDPAPQQTLVDMTTDPQNELQQLLGDMLRNEASFDDFLKSQESNAVSLQTLLNLFYALVLAVLALGYGIKFYRLAIPRLSPSERQYLLCYRAALDRLAAVGLSRRYGESREAFAARLAQSIPSLLPITNAHLAIALGKVQQSEAAEDYWQGLEKNIRQEIISSTALWKQVLAIINPFSWLLSR